MTLRQFPLPVRIVLTTFMLAVGVGYVSAMVQLHFKEAGPGNAMPGPTEVVAIYSGTTFPTPPAGSAAVTPPVSKLQHLIQAPESEPWSSSGSMSRAFTTKADDWVKAWDKDTAMQAEERALRAGEQLALIAWIKAGAKKAEYEADAFPLPEAANGKASAAYFDADTKLVKIKSVMTDRCARCHSAEGEQSDHPLETYADLQKYLVVSPGTGDPAKAKQISVEHLAQSTHAHLLSFAMLFTLTGLVFALTDYPVWLRCIVGPLALVAQLADVSCWWLARLDGVGPYFALAIMATGGVVGLTLVTQIVLSVFNMYGRTGKGVLAALFVTGAVGALVLEAKVVRPQLQAERAALESAATAGAEPPRVE